MAEAKQHELADFMDLFRGNAHAYGQHVYDFSGGGKERGKNSTVTGKLLTSEQYKQHLAGKTGLGVIPIDDEGLCRFGVIDLDVYDAKLEPFIATIERSSFPLVPFRSKSGGLHVYLFLKKPVNARAVIDVLHDMSAVLGLDLFVKGKLNKLIEVFPKQHKTTEGGVGNWINLPYFDAEKGKQRAVRRGEDLSFDDALAYAKEKRRSLSEVRDFLKELPHRDGPPCLQTISISDVMGPESGRNNYLFSFGVYLKKKDADFWEQKLFEVNASMQSPLSKEELEGTVVSSLRKKDYTYRCSEAPCADYCRKPECKRREFGVGKEGGYFSELEFGKLTQIKASEPYYEWDVKVQGAERYVSMRFRSEADIIGQDAFLKLCFRELHTLPVKMKQSEWFKLINQALVDLEVKAVDVEDDTSPLTMFKSLFIDFLTKRALAQTKAQILNRRVYLDAKLKRYYFRTRDLNDYVFSVKGFRYVQPGELHGILHDFLAIPTRVWTETSKQVRVYEISTDAVEKLSSVQDEPFVADFTKKETEEY